MKVRLERQLESGEWKIEGRGYDTEDLNHLIMLVHSASWLGSIGEHDKIRIVEDK